MRVAILANHANSFYRPLAEGLERMFKGIGVDTILLYDGLTALPRRPVAGAGAGANWKGKLFRVAQECGSWLNYRKLLGQLRPVDFAVIVGHMPRAYFDHLIDD